MTRIPLRLLPAIIGLCIAAIAPDGYGDADDGERSSAPMQRRSGALELTADQVERSGLRTVTLAAVAVQPQSKAYGRVLDIQPLLDLRSRYRTAQSELTIAEAALDVARKSRQRIASLHRESIIATRDLVQAEAQLTGDSARVETARRHLQEVREDALQAWGDELFRRAVGGDSRWFEGLLTRRQVLVLVALPPGQSLPDSAHQIALSEPGDRQTTRTATLISAAPRTDDTTQGETWFFVTAAERLRTGMRVEARIPQAGAAITGVVVPPDALVWHEGKPWVYVKSAPSTYVRRPIGQHADQADGWFVTDGLDVGDELVVVGAQMLLSDELRQRIPTEDDD